MASFDFSSVGIYVINMDKRPDRLEKMAQWLDGLGIAWTRVPGVDGFDLSEKVVNSINAKAARPLLRGEIGCAMSHILAWNMAKKDGTSHIWVMEDDVLPVMSPNLLRIQLGKITTTKGYELLYTDGRTSTKRFFDICSPEHLLPYLEEDSELHGRIYVNKHYSRVGPQIGAYSYILISGALNSVFEFFETIINPVDVQLGQMNSWVTTCLWNDELIEHVYDGTSDSSKG